MTGVDWIRTAMSDDSLVAAALLLLRHAEPPQLKPPPSREGVSALKLEWTVRQRRSKAGVPSRKKGDQARASPTTPLSWSGATTSVSDTGAAVNGVEESSGAVKAPETVRSKIFQTTRTPTPFKRSTRRKKTLAELREAEGLLLKERNSLRDELASLRVFLKQQRERSDALKKLKAEFQSSHGALDSSSSSSSSSSCKREECDVNNDSFVLPDLNIPLNHPS